ncbi:MAG: CBS domain-containing protein, partial [Candidatus Eiseniibacteriota bacterium]
MSALDPVERIETLCVGDVMIALEDYPAVSPETSLREAIRIMELAQLDVGGRLSLPRILLVIDDGRLVGHVRRRDIMRGLEPSYLLAKPLDYRKKWFDIQVDPLMAEFTAGRVVKAIRDQAERPVRQIMLPIQGSLDHCDHIITAVYEMVAMGVPLLP